jgi:phosphoribosyl 1,2-cyclic phosphodiesterase
VTLEISFLGSGSSGNCAVIRSGDTAVLLDAGLSVRETGRRLKERGLTLESIAAVFVTHEHSDHARAAVDFALRLGVPVYATLGTSGRLDCPGPLFADVRPVADGRRVVVNAGAFEVRVTSTPHDGAESVCYVFQDGDGRRIGVATDLGHLSPGVLDALADCEVLGLESNHDVDLLREGPYPWSLKQRILSTWGHLSNEDAAAALARLVGPRTKAVVALHVSRHNNTAALAERTFRRSLSDLGAHVTLEVAPPYAPTRWVGA